MQRLTSAIIAGEVAGVVMGAILTLVGIMPAIASLVGSHSIGVGWLVHLTLSAVIGAGLAIFFGKVIRDLSSGLLYGLAYGLVWWVLGALVLMPVLLGMPPRLSLGAMVAAWPSLLGHILFGLVLGFVYVKLINAPAAVIDLTEG